MIRFHFDFLSPYAYVAWTQIHGLAAQHGREVRPVPTLLAPLLRNGDTKGPAEIPAKRLYMFKDVVRTAHRLNVPIAPPPTHPFNPLLPLRAASVLQGDDQRRLIDALFQAAWGVGTGAETPEQVARAAASVGLDGPALVAAAGMPEARDRLRVQTEAAIRDGVFGVPTMCVDGELFWGFDAFGHLDRFLGGEDPVAPAALARWAELGASAQRRH